MRGGSMAAFEAARNIEDAIDGYDGDGADRPLEKTEDAMPPDDESYQAHIRAAALACHCCPCCCAPPCDGCLAGGMCDDAECRCDDLDNIRRENCDD